MAKEPFYFIPEYLHHKEGAKQETNEELENIASCARIKIGKSGSLKNKERADGGDK